VALRVLAAQADHHAKAEQSAHRAAAISDSRWRNGVASHLELLDSQRSAWSSQAAVLQAQAARAQATVGLIRVLGGGWGDARVPDGAPAQRPGS
jgi:multidrug efflux system outer membrane protein